MSDAEHQARALDRSGDELERRPVVRQGRCEAALVTESGRVAGLLQHALEGVVDLGAVAHGVGEGGRTDRRDHELLDVDVGVGVRATVEDVHHRDGEHVRVGTTEVAEQRQLRGQGRGLGHCERDAEDGVRAEAGLVGGAVQVDHRLIEQPLLGGLESDDLSRDLDLSGLDRVEDALAAVPLSAVTTLGGLEGAGRGSGRDGGASHRVVVEQDLHFDRGVATGVEDFAGNDRVDERHGHSLWAPPGGDAIACAPPAGTFARTVGPPA